MSLSRGRLLITLPDSHEESSKDELIIDIKRTTESSDARSITLKVKIVSHRYSSTTNR